MGSFRRSPRVRKLRREALLPLPGASRFPMFLAISTMVVLFAGAMDALLWTQSVVQSQARQRAYHAQTQIELLRVENQRLRLQNVEMALDLAQSVEREQRQLFAQD